MSTSPSNVPALDFDIADRMRKSLRASDIAVGEIADYLGVSRNTVGTWINGRIRPSKQTCRLWAMRTGVPLSWLETGEMPEDPTCPRPESNWRPTRYQVARNRRSVAGGRADRRLNVVA